MTADPRFLSAHSAFKAYDVRGRVPEQLNAGLCERIAAAYAKVIRPRQVALGHDIRLSSPELAQAAIRGLRQQGVDVVDIGLCGTEEIYYAVSQWELDGGIMITASHNPSDYNGIKMVGSHSRPVGRNNGLAAIQELALSTDPLTPPAEIAEGNLSQREVHGEYARFALSKVNLSLLPPSSFKVLCNPGNGGAGLVLSEIARLIPTTLVMHNAEPDGSFPHGVPNPLLPDRRQETSQAVMDCGASLGVAWDGDFDRCFFFDEQGRFVEGYYLVALFAQRFLRQSPPGTRIVHDPRLTWNTIEQVRRYQGVPVMSRTGHAFIKDRMREEDAVYGGEMSAHHYFKEFFYCDSGILPFLFMLELLGGLSEGRPLSRLVDAMMLAYPVSGEINRRVGEETSAILNRVQESLAEKYGPPLNLDRTDGLSLEYAEFRLNLRASNTEPLIRLNVESRHDPELMEQVRDLALKAIGGTPAA